MEAKPPRSETNALLIEFAEEIQSLKRRVACLERDKRRLEMNYCPVKAKCKTGMNQVFTCED